MSKKPVSPGKAAPDSGQYVPVTKGGCKVNSGEITAIKGKPLPPTPGPNQGWALTDATKHKK